MKSYPFQLRLLISLLLAIVIIFCAVIGRSYFIPLFIATLFAYLLYPLNAFMERYIPRILAILFSILIAVGLISFVVILLSSQVEKFLQDLPEMQEQVQRNVRRLEQFIGEKTGYRPNIKSLALQLTEVSGAFIADAFKATAGTATRILLMPVFVFFILYYRDKFRDFVFKLVPEEDYPKANKILREVSFVATNYMGGVVIVIMILCVINSTGLLIIGLEFALLFGILSAVMNFIPYFGTLMGGAIPLLYALVTQDDLSIALKIVLLFIAIQFLENNILTPNITGGKVKLNPFVTILSIIAGGIIWGVPGMFLVIPVLGVIRVVCINIESLHPYAFILGTDGTEEHAVNLKNIKLFFKKIRKKMEE